MCKLFEIKVWIVLSSLFNKCAFYGYLPTRNCTKALTSRSGNVEPVKVESVRTNPTAIHSRPYRYRAFSVRLYLRYAFIQELTWICMLSAKMASDTAIPSNCDETVGSQAKLLPINCTKKQNKILYADTYLSSTCGGCIGVTTIQHHTEVIGRSFIHIHLLEVHLLDLHHSHDADEKWFIINNSGKLGRVFKLDISTHLTRHAKLYMPVVRSYLLRIKES